MIYLNRPIVYLFSEDIKSTLFTSYSKKKRKKTRNSIKKKTLQILTEKIRCNQNNIKTTCLFTFQFIAVGLQPQSRSTNANAVATVRGRGVKFRRIRQTNVVAGNCYIDEDKRARQDNSIEPQEPIWFQISCGL